MDKKKTINKIREFFEKMTINEEIEDFKIEENKISFKIQSEDSSFLIGKHGENLFNIQYLLSRMINKKEENRYIIDFDINNYKERREEYLKDLAENIADEVSITKKQKELPHLSAYERRVIHSVVSEREDVISESIGEGNERYVVIKPI